jgi:hypothetical protein
MKSLLKIISDTDCIIYKDTLEIGKISANKILELPLRVGIYIIEIVNQNDKSNKLSFDYHMETEDFEDLLRVSLKNKKGSSQNRITPLQIECIDNLKRYIKENNKSYSIIDTDTNFEIPLKYDEVGYFSEGLAACCIRNKWGYIDKNGVEVIPLKFVRAEKFCNGLAEVKISSDQNGFIDRTGNLTVTYLYKEDFNEYGFCGVQKNFTSWGANAGCGFIDRTGKEVIPAIWGNGCISFLSAFLLRASKYNLWGVINIKNERVVPIIYNEVSILGSKYILVKHNGKYGLMNLDGQSLTPIKYDGINILGYKHILVKQDNKYGLINLEGQSLTPIKYDEINMLGYKHILVKQGNKYGLIDLEGQSLTPIKYDNIKIFQEGFAIVKLENKNGFINELGEEAILSIYDESFNFKNGLAQVRIGNKFGLIDYSGKTIVPIVYDAIVEDFGNVVKIKIDKKWGCVNRSGKEILPVEYDEIQPENNLIWARKEEQWIFWRDSRLFYADKSCTNDATVYEEDYNEKDYNDPFADYGSSYARYGGYNGYSDDEIDDLFDGNPEASWNID